MEPPKQNHFEDVRFGVTTGTLSVDDKGLQFLISNEASPLLSLPLQSLLEHKMYTKRNSARLRLSGRERHYEFEFASVADQQSFLAAVAFLQEGGRRGQEPSGASSSPPSLLPTSQPVNVPTEQSRARSSSGCAPKIATNDAVGSESQASLGSSSNQSTSLDSTLPLGKTKEFLTVTLGNPTKVSSDLSHTDTYVVFAISTQTNIEKYRSEKRGNNGAYIWTSHRRFREFENLREELMRNHPHAAVPPLPQKAWMSTDITIVISPSNCSRWPHTVDRFNQNFIDERTIGLNRFLSIISSNQRLMTSDELHTFLTNDPHKHAIAVEASVGVSPPKSTGMFDKYLRDNPLTTALESTLMSAWSGSRNLDKTPIFDTQMELDYFSIQQIAKRWDLVPSKLPFQKFVVLALGTTSAGKSSFINHYFGVNVKKEADAQQDVTFTLVEVVPTSVFRQYSPHASPDPSVELEFPEYTQEELQSNVADLYSDRRYGHVFVYLDTASTLSRYYTQLSQYASVISKFNLFQSVLISEHYVRSESPYSSLIRRTLMIDTPGFTSEKFVAHDIIDQFMGNLRILQALYSLSDLTLFFVPATNLNMVSNQLSVLELSLLYSTVGEELMEKLISKASSTKPDKGSFFINFIGKIKRALHAHEEVVYKFQGTAAWEKTLVLLSKVDQLRPVQDALRNAYYELGCLLNASLIYLPPPTPDSIIPLALPQFEDSLELSQIKSLFEKIKARAFQSPYEKRVEVAIQTLCQDLRRVVGQSWSKFVTRDSTDIEQILARSVQRVQTIGYLMDVLVAWFSSFAGINLCMAFIFQYHEPTFFKQSQRDNELISSLYSKSRYRDSAAATSSQNVLTNSNHPPRNNII